MKLRTHCKRFSAFAMALVVALFLLSAGTVGAANIGTYDQCSNDQGTGYTTGDTGCRWINGNLQSNNSVYYEGDATVQRLWLDGLAPGSTHTVTFQYGTTKGGKHAYDFLTTWDWSENWITVVDRCQGITGCEGASTESTYAIPQDSNAKGFDSAARVFTMRGGTITGVSTPTIASGSYSSDSETSITVNFTVAPSGGMCTTSGSVTTCGIAIWFGAHVASQLDWGAGTGAASINGAPYHVALAALDGASVGQRDNQMMASTIVQSSTPTPTPTATATATVAATSTATPTSTAVPTNTPTATPTNTVMPTETPTATPTNTSTPTQGPTETPTATPTNTTVPTEGPTVTPTETASPPAAPTSTATPTATAVPTSPPSPPSGPSADLFCVQDSNGNWSLKSATKGTPEYDAIVSGPHQTPVNGQCPANPTTPPPPPPPTNTPVPAAVVAAAPPPPPPPAPTATPLPPAVEAAAPAPVPAPPAPPSVMGEQPGPVPQRLPYTGEADEADGGPLLGIAASLLLIVAGTVMNMRRKPAAVRVKK